MKRNTFFALASLALGAAFTLAPSASAQQATSNLQRQMDAARKQQAQSHAAVHAFPIPASYYHAKMAKALERLRTMTLRGPITAADVNKAILRMKECEAAVTADGVVTAAEMRYCNNVMTQMRREKVHEIMATTGPDDWARWGKRPTQTAAPTQK